MPDNRMDELMALLDFVQPDPRIAAMEKMAAINRRRMSDPTAMQMMDKNTQSDVPNLGTDQKKYLDKQAEGLTPWPGVWLGDDLNTAPQQWTRDYPYRGGQRPYGSTGVDRGKDQSGY